MGQKKHDRKIVIPIVLMTGSLWLHFIVLDALQYWYVWMVRCGRPAVFVWLCKLRTIEGHVLLCYAMVVSSTNIFKVKESQRLHVVLFCRVRSMYTQSTVCFRQCCHPQNTSRRTAAGRFVALLVHLLTTVAWYSTWSSIVSDLHNHTNAARRP